MCIRDSNNLVEAGYMSAGQVLAARLNPAKIIESRPTQSPDWFLDWAFEEVQRVAEGRGQYVLTARVTVDLAMQQAAQDALVNNLRHTASSHRKGYSGALVAMEPDGACSTNSVRLSCARLGVPAAEMCAPEPTEFGAPMQ